MLLNLGWQKVRRRQFLRGLGVTAALPPVVHVHSAEPVWIPIPPDFPPHRSFILGRK